MKISDLKQDSNNYRIHDERNLNLLKKSIDEYGFGRSIVIDSENEIIAGNGLASQVPPDTKVRLIETDGSELVVVKRTDLATNDEKRKGLAVMDNSTTDSSKFDTAKLQNDFSIPELQDMGVPMFDTTQVDIDGFFENSEAKEKKPKMVKCPHCGEEFEL